MARKVDIREVVNAQKMPPLPPPPEDVGATPRRSHKQNAADQNPSRRFQEQVAPVVGGGVRLQTPAGPRSRRRFRRHVRRGYDGGGRAVHRG